MRRIQIHLRTLLILMLVAGALLGANFYVRSVKEVIGYGGGGDSRVAFITWQRSKIRGWPFDFQVIEVSSATEVAITEDYLPKLNMPVRGTGVDYWPIAFNSVLAFVLQLFIFRICERGASPLFTRVTKISLCVLTLMLVLFASFPRYSRNEIWVSRTKFKSELRWQEKYESGWPLVLSVKVKDWQFHEYTDLENCNFWWRIHVDLVVNVAILIAAALFIEIFARRYHWSGTNEGERR